MIKNDNGTAAETVPQIPIEVDIDEVLKQRVFLTPSAVAPNRFGHVLRNEDNTLEYFESLTEGRASELLRQRLSDDLGIDWPKIDNKKLTLFDANKVQRDTTTECYLYFLNGTVRITRGKKGIDFLEGSNRPMIWKTTVLQRVYKKSNETHEIATLAGKCAIDYKALQVGIGYLLHRHWSRNMTKIVWAVDYMPESRHDGRRGKDLFTSIVSECRTWVSAKWKKGHNFWTGVIQPDTAIAHFEDVHNGMAIDEEMKKCVTGDLSIEHKGRNVFTRNFADKPKFSASSQRYPMDYMDESIRGRIFLIEFNSYLQTNPPKRTLVYDDQDKSAFDAWMIECVQVYFNNQDRLIGTPALTKEQTDEAMRTTYGAVIFDTVFKVKKVLKKRDRIEVSEVLSMLETNELKILNRFKECYQRYTNRSLDKIRPNVKKGEVKVYYYREHKQ